VTVRIGFIGFGSIARDTIAALQRAGAEVEFAGAYASSRPSAKLPIPFFDTLDALLASRPDLIVECASQQAVAEHGETVLTAGIPLLIVSIGALGDDNLRERLSDCAVRHGSQVLLPAGAVGAIDALAAARYAGLERVIYRAQKPASAWKSSAADDLCDLDALTVATTFYRGNARDAARLFPKNSNVAATVALAGIGFDATEVELIADPSATDNQHIISASGAAGRFEIMLSGKPSPANPKTSILTAMSVARVIINQQAALVI
jgi:aspartate dehydrogenase